MMPNWHDINTEIKKEGSPHDIIRRQYLKRLQDYSKRNTIIYYSGWLQKPEATGVEVNDEDKNGFMTVIHHMDKTKGLDLILHTPGGEVAATESLVDYIRSVFGTNIRVIVPQLALSAGTMIACAAKEIVMGLHSSLGPIDPQFMGLPAHGVIEEFDRANKEVAENKLKFPIWQTIIAKYHPTLIGECEKAIIWSKDIAKEWLLSGMLECDGDAEVKAEKIIFELSDHALNKSHSRHLSAEKCKNIGLKVVSLEKDPDFQDRVLSVHHACIHTLTATGAYKLIENHDGVAFIKVIRQILVQS
jgi:ATP-dependent protease ClpP protease subunit